MAVYAEHWDDVASFEGVLLNSYTINVLDLEKEPVVAVTEEVSLEEFHPDFRANSLYSIFLFEGSLTLCIIIVLKTLTDQ